MRLTLTKHEWEQWRDKELDFLKKYLKEKNISLHAEQKHIIGERYLMSGKKLVVQGTDQITNKDLIIKYSNDPDGIKELVQEQQAKVLIDNIHFGYKKILFPEVISWEVKGNFALLMTEFIPQENVFVKLPIEDQFFLSVKILEIFESIHSVVGSHEKYLSKLNKVKKADDYIKDLQEKIQEIANSHLSFSATTDILLKVHNFFVSNKLLLSRYCDFLTHDDFAPHNMRVLNENVYVLDNSSLILGNKYESWGRFLNFMIIHSPQLEKLLSQYVLINRGIEEYTMLRMMRMYKAVFLIHFYILSLQKTDGALKLINEHRAHMWTAILDLFLSNKEVPDTLVNEHASIMNSHRSEEEKKRQKDISG